MRRLAMLLLVAVLVSEGCATPYVWNEVDIHRTVEVPADAPGEPPLREETDEISMARVCLKGALLPLAVIADVIVFGPILLVPSAAKAIEGWSQNNWR